MDNGGQDASKWLGPPVLDYFLPPVRSFYEDLFTQVRESGEPADHRYQCSSPELYREYSMRVLPLEGGRLLVIHHLVVDSPHGDSKSPAPRYQGPGGLVTLCCHCRRTQRAGDITTWDWVPAYLDAKTGISHGLCEACATHYYGEP